MNDLRLAETRRGDVLVVTVTGEVNISTAPAFQRKLTDIVTSGEAKIVLDLGDTSYISSSGLGAISEAAKKLRKKGGELCLARVQYLSREVMEFFGLIPFVKICDDLDDALKHLTQPRKSP